MLILLGNELTDFSGEVSSAMLGHSGQTWEGRFLKKGEEGAWNEKD